MVYIHNGLHDPVATMTEERKMSAMLRVDPDLHSRMKRMATMLNVPLQAATEDALEQWLQTAALAIVIQTHTTTGAQDAPASA